MTLNRRLTILTCGMPRGEQRNAATQCLSQQEAGGPQDMGEHELQQCMSSWNSSNSLKTSSFIGMPPRTQHDTATSRKQ